MTFKFPVGQLVEFAPPSEMPALYRVARQMPVEDARVDLAYLIKPERQGFSRVDKQGGQQSESAGKFAIVGKSSWVNKGYAKR